ncbi:MAG: universal stress protein [bacterium]
MLPVNKILCPTDFSEHSYKAVKAAEELAKKLSATLLLVHVVPPVPDSSMLQTGPTGYSAPSSAGGFNITEYIKDLEANAKKSLEKIVKDKIKEDIKVETVVLAEGDESDEINQFAKDRNVDMIVVSTHGRTGLGRLFFGSVAEKIIRHAQKPVLTIRSTE